MSHKKILAILGSPHAAGATATMLNLAIRSAEVSGYEVIKIDLYEKQICFCKGCRSCLHNGSCVQQDDMQEIIPLLKECQTVILAAPVYWANVPAPVKNLFDRLLGIAMEETDMFPKPRLSGKTYLLLTACKTPFPFSWICGQSRGAIRNMDEFFKTAGMRCKGRLVWTSPVSRREIPKSLANKIERIFQQSK